MRGAIWMTMVAAAALLAGCAQYGRQGLTRTARYHSMACPQIDAERGRVEVATNRLFQRAARRGVFRNRSAAEVNDGWPTMLFLRGKGGHDRQRYQQLSMSYEQLRIAATQKGCTLTFASDVSNTIRAGQVAAAD